MWFFSNWLSKNMVLFFPSQSFSRYEYCSTKTNMCFRNLGTHCAREFRRDPETQLHFQVSKKQSFSFSIRLLQNCDDMPPGRNGANNNSCSITSHCMEYPTKKKVLLENGICRFLLTFYPKRTAPVFCKASFFKGTKTKII